MVFAQEIIVELDYSDCRHDTHIGAWDHHTSRNGSILISNSVRLLFWVKIEKNIPVACVKTVGAKPTIRMYEFEREKATRWNLINFYGTIQCHEITRLSAINFISDPKWQAHISVLPEKYLDCVEKKEGTKFEH